MRGKRFVAAAAVVAGTAAVAASAPAGPGKIKPTPDRSAENRRAATKLGRAVAVRRTFIKSGNFSALPPFSAPSAISTKRLAGFPVHGRSYIMLSTGDTKEAARPNSSGDRGTQVGGPSVRGSRDVTILRLNLRVPENARCLSIRFRFLTEEFPEYVDTQYNDAFIAELDRSDWNTVSKEDPTIHAPRNFAHDAEGRLISVNAAGDASVKASRAKGTTYDGATRLLRASTRITPGRHILYLSIFDQGDREFDSTVFIDKLTLDRRSPCKSGAVVDN